jgi:hypothetical protein
MNPNPSHSAATAERKRAMNTGAFQPSPDMESRAYGHAVAPAVGAREREGGGFERTRPATAEGPHLGREHTSPAGLEPQIGRPNSRRDRPGTTRLLSLPEAASYLGLSWWTTRELVMGGTIPAVRLPAPRATDGRLLRRILIDMADLDGLIAKWKDRSA